MNYISQANLARLLDILQRDYEVYVPVKKGEQRFFKKYAGFTNDVVIGEVRPFEPLKSFFSPAREIVAKDFKPDIPHSEDKPLAIVGVKACDLKGFKIQDYVFKDHDYQDPFYIKRRRENLVISADCTSTLDTCFCLSMDVKPYPQENFDINLSPVGEGYIVEVGSPKGQQLLENNTSLFEDVNNALVSERDQQRARVVSEVEENIKKHGIPHQDALEGVVEKKFESDIWKDEAATCVECGACNTVCPTCHCFLLYDQRDEQSMARLRIWDSCMIKDFARVAGGANPRPELWMRLRNRFEKKFDFFPKVADTYACTGCGRCISACPGKIDIRKVLKKLTERRTAESMEIA